jgi:hypothetical protein
MSGGTRRVRATFWLLDAPDSLSIQSYREPDGTGLFEPGELLHVGADFDASPRVAPSDPPAQLLTYADLYPQDAASQAA